MACVDKQSCKIISIVVGICVVLAGLDVAWTYFGPCEADVMMMMDDSGSISDKNFEKVKKFVYDLPKNEQLKDQLDDKNIQIGMATFSHCAKWMNSKDCDDRPALKFVHNSYSIQNILENYNRMDSTTNMIQALEFVNNRMLKQARPGSDKILLFMTDGKSQDENNIAQSLQTITQSADKLKEKKR